MRALLQRATGREVRVDGEVVGAIGRGLVVLLGVGPADDEAVAERWRAGSPSCGSSTTTTGRTNLSLLDVGGAALVVSPVHALRRHAPRSAARIHRRRGPGSRRAPLPPLRGGAAGARRGVATGRFGEEMAVELVNDGPFTIWLDTDDR